MILPAHFDAYVVAQNLAWLVDPPLTGKHLAGKNQRLSACATFRQTTCDKEKVGANPAQAAADISSVAEPRHELGSANSAWSNRLFSA